jgi:Tfp pilus assembly protein PilN
VRPVNLVPSEQRRGSSGAAGGKAAYAVIGVLAALAAMLTVYVLTANTVTERTNKAAVAAVEADRLEAEAARKASFADFAQIAQTRLQSVAGVAETRFDWERVMRELSRIMPEGSWLQSADASVSGVTEDASDGGTSSGTAAATPQPALTLVGCTRKQTEVAQLMVRMRAMHRVTEVELNQSTQEDLRGPATVDDCGSLYQFDVTAKFEAAPPADEAPEGANGVPASLGGGS